MACGGLYMWWIRRRPKSKATANTAQRPKRSARWKATRLHSTIGAWIFIGLLGLSATGITWSGLAGENVDSLVERMNWKATPIETALPGTTAETHEHTGHEGHEGHGVGGASSSTSVATEAERALATGRAEGLTGPPTGGRQLRLAGQRTLGGMAHHLRCNFGRWRHRRGHRPPAFLQPAAV